MIRPEVFMCHIGHSHYTVRALESIGSRYRIHLMDVSYYCELGQYARRNEHVVYYRPDVCSRYDRELGHIWSPPCIAESWNEMLAAIDTPWAFHVGPDVLLGVASLGLFEAQLEHLQDENIIAALARTRDGRPGWDLFAIRTEQALALGGFDTRYPVCGTTDDDFLYTIVDRGKRWMIVGVPYTHMDGGHKTSAHLELTIPMFEEKWGIPLGKKEYWEKVMGGAS